MQNKLRLLSCLAVLGICLAINAPVRAEEPAMDGAGETPAAAEDMAATRAESKADHENMKALHDKKRAERKEHMEKRKAHREEMRKKHAEHMKKRKEHHAKMMKKEGGEASPATSPEAAPASND